MTSRGVRGIVVAAACAALLAGCTMVHPNPFRTVPDDPVAAARALPGAPDWVAEPAGEDCGTVQQSYGDGAIDPAGLDCLGAAVATGREGSLAWISYTTEGDPIPHFARADAEGVDVASTSEWDAYGGAGWHVTRCAEAADLPYGDGCEAG